MSIETDHTIVPSHHARDSAQKVAGLLGVPWAPTGAAPFAPVHLNDGFTLDGSEPDGHHREVLTVNRARQPAPGPAE